MSGELSIGDWVGLLWDAVAKDTDSLARSSHVAELVRAIQSDASRSAARSERERCLAVCEAVAAELSDNCDGGSVCAEEIRKLPDVPA